MNGPDPVTVTIDRRYLRVAAAAIALHISRGREVGMEPTGKVLDAYVAIEDAARPPRPNLRAGLATGNRRASVARRKKATRRR